MWAFSNCRVDAPGRPVAEVDWFFYNVRHGTLMVSEWKGFPQRVALATDTGTPWLLDGGLALPNPIEQVSRQLDAVRAALRGAILPQHFPAFDALQLRLMQSVYSPQVDQNTTIERIRWGKVYGDLPELAAVIANSTSRSPLFLPDAGARLALATALCALFRTTFPPEAETKLRVSPKGGDTDVVLRISEIHRQIAALHAELADLVVTAAGDGNPGRPAAGRRHGPEGGGEGPAGDGEEPSGDGFQVSRPDRAPADARASDAKLPGSQRQCSCRYQGTGEGVEVGARRPPAAWRNGNQRGPVRQRGNPAGEAAPRVPSKGSWHAVAQVVRAAGQSRRPAPEGRSRKALEPTGALTRRTAAAALCTIRLDLAVGPA